MKHSKNESGPAATKVQLTPDDGIFELPGVEPAWVWVHTCPTPDCSCRDALILATHEGRDLLLERGSAIHDAWNAGNDYSDEAAALDDLIVFYIDIDTGEASTPTDYEALELAAHPHIASFATRIDGDLLDAMGRLWYRAKGRPIPEQNVLPAAQLKINGWQRDDMLAWDDIYTGVRYDLFAFDGRVYEAADMYCPKPECACGEVTIHFDTIMPRGAPSPGRVIVQRSGATEMEPHKNGRVRLEQLWAAYCRRHPNHVARFERRYPVVKRIGAQMVPAPPAVSAKVGRNEACPCGSGRKYKKCCGAG